jgi:hypothetical protein
MSYVHINISGPDKESSLFTKSLQQFIKHDNWIMRQHAWGNDEKGILFNTDLLLPANDTKLIADVMIKIPSHFNDKTRLSFKCNTNKLYQADDSIPLPKRKSFQLDINTL